MPSLGAERSADAKEHGLVALVMQLLEREIPAQPLAGLDIDAHALDHADFFHQRVPRKPIRRNGLHEHPARRLLRLENPRLVAEAGQEVRTGQAGRTGADHGDLSLRIRRVLQDVRKLRLCFPVRP